MSDYPGILTYRDILAVPYVSLYGERLHVGGPIWHDWDEPTPARFFRESMPADERPSELPAAARVDTPNSFWIGPLPAHFGHFMLESASRIAPSILADPSAELVLATHPGGPRTLTEAPTWLRGLLGWHGVGPERVRVLDRPTRFACLRVAPQPERAGFEDPPPPHADHLDALTERARRNLGEFNPRGALFVSRAGSRSQLVGEAYLDEVFRRAGVSVIHPEAMSFADQLRSYAKHRVLIFSEGSAFHGFQQLGRHPGEAAILKRRPEVDFGHVVGPPRFRRFELLETTRARVVDRRANGSLNTAGGLSFIDVECLLQGMDSFGIDLASHWSEAEFRTAERNQAVRWMLGKGRRAVVALPRQLPGLVAALQEARLPGAVGWAVRLARHVTGAFEPPSGVPPT